MRRVLVLRPEPGSTATLARLRAHGLQGVSAPLFDIEPIEWTAPDASAFDGLLLTSANAVRFGGSEIGKLKSLPVFAVGEATAKAARDAGFEVALTGNAGVDSLLANIPPEVRLVHPCGVDRKAPKNTPRSIAAVTVYRAMPLAAPDLAGAAGSVAMIHSPRAGSRFAELMEDRSSIAIAAISPVAAEGAGTGWESVEVAEQASDEALLALVLRLCNKPSPK